MFECKKQINLENYSFLGDEEKLLQVLGNLLDNAIKYTDKGFAKLSVQLNNKQLEFIIEDSSTGILESDYNHIYKKFRLSQLVGYANQEGLGLGLAISRAFMELMGGSIKFRSEVGKGSVFFVTIPVENYP